MNFLVFAKRVEKLLIDNSPAILTIIGVTGTITTSWLTGTASFKAADILRKEGMDNYDDSLLTPFTFRDKVGRVWKCYIPAVGTGAFTIFCIIFANRIGMRRAAAVAAAYSISEKAFGEYKDKVVEKFGDNQEQKVRDELAQDRVNRNPLNEREIIITGDGEVLCYEAFTGRYFKSSMEEIKRAQNDINAEIIHNSYASLSDFYNALGIGKTSCSDEVGWNTDKLLELKFTTVLSEDNRPCISIGFDVAPVRDYWR